MTPGAYFDALTAYRTGDVDAIVLAVANASFDAVGNGRALVSDINATRDRWATAITARADSSVHRALDHLLAQPIVTTATLAAALSVTEVTAGTTIRRLVDAGILTKASGNARYRVWQCCHSIGGQTSPAS